MFFEENSDYFNGIYTHCVKRHQKHLLSAERYETFEKFTRVPLLVSTSVATALSLLTLTAPWAQIAITLCSVSSAILHGLPLVYDIKAEITRHRESAKRYLNIINLLEYEYAVNGKRKADFCPYHIELETSDASSERTTSRKIPIPTKEEYAEYLFHRVELLEQLADDLANVVPEDIEQREISRVVLIE